MMKAYINFFWKMRYTYFRRKPVLVIDNDIYIQNTNPMKSYYYKNNNIFMTSTSSVQHLINVPNCCPEDVK